MNNSLSFRKETIQRSSNESGAGRLSAAGLPQDQGPRHARDQRKLAITTVLTVTQ